MQVRETQNEGLKRAYAITVPAAELEAKVAEKLEAARKDFQMKGFRKGKAPAALMKKMFGKSVLGEAMQESIDAAVREHFESSGNRPAGQPDVKMTNEGWAEGQDIEVSMTYEALPEVPEVDFAAIELERLVVEIDDAAVEEALGGLASSAASFEDRAEGEAAQDGDQIVVDFRGEIDGETFEGGEAEDFPLVLGSGGFVAGFAEQLVGAVAGEAREVRVAFPEDYAAAQLAGKTVDFHVTVKAVKAPRPAEIDDALAERYGADDLDALKAQIRERIAGEYRDASRAVLKRRLMDALDAKVSFDLPSSLVDMEARQIAHQLWHEEHPDHHGHDHDAIEPTEGHRRLAERRVRLGLLLADVGGKQGLKVNEQETQRAVVAQARRYPGREREFLEMMRATPGALQQVTAPILEEKVVEYVLELARVTERPVDREEMRRAIDALDEESPTAA